MKNTIRKIFDSAIDDEVHNEFVKFSRGVFENRYLLEGKNQKDRWTIKSSSEFANFFVKKILSKAKGDVEISGIIVSTSDIEKDCSFAIENVKKYMGIKQLVLKCSASAEKIIELIGKHPKAFYALSFSIPGYELRIKAKPPKSAKPGTKTKDGEEGPKADFCSLKTSDGEIVKDLFFDVGNFNEIKVNHTLQINEIEIPKNAKTPEEMRSLARRKGILKRFVNVDGRKETREARLEV